MAKVLYCVVCKKIKKPYSVTTKRSSTEIGTVKIRKNQLIREYGKGAEDEETMYCNDCCEDDSVKFIEEREI